MKSCALSCHVLEMCACVVSMGKKVAHSVGDRNEGMGGRGDLESADRGRIGTRHCGFDVRLYTEVRFRASPHILCEKEVLRLPTLSLLLISMSSRFWAGREFPGRGEAVVCPRSYVWHTDLRMLSYV
jgi:hypothetical protein